MTQTSTPPTASATAPSDRVGPGQREDVALRSVDQRIERLSKASLKRIMEPDTEVPGAVGDGQVLPDELLSLANVPELFDRLSAEQKRTLSREEFASIVDTGVRFESVLMAGFSIDILSRRDLTDPRVTYLLHEMGEETRHSRLFVRLLEQVKPRPRTRSTTRSADRAASSDAVPHGHAVAVLPARAQRRGGPRPAAEAGQRAPRHRPDDQGGVEIPPPGRGTPPRLRPMLFPEQWAAAGPIERFLVRHLGSRIAKAMFDTIVHPGVYGAVGLPTWATWKAVNRSAGRTAMRHRALRPLLTPLLEADVFRGGRVPKGWRTPVASTAPVGPSTRSRRPDPVPSETTRRDRARPVHQGRPTRQALLDAAIVRFAREGYRGTSVADVCRDAGSPPRRRIPTSPTRRRSSSPRSTRTSPG